MPVVYSYAHRPLSTRFAPLFRGSMTAGQQQQQAWSGVAECRCASILWRIPRSARSFSHKPLPACAAPPRNRAPTSWMCTPPASPRNPTPSSASRACTSDACEPEGQPPAPQHHKGYFRGQLRTGLRRQCSVEAYHRRQALEEALTTTPPTALRQAPRPAYRLSRSLPSPPPSPVIERPLARQATVRFADEPVVMVMVAKPTSHQAAFPFPAWCGLLAPWGRARAILRKSKSFGQ
jgi:hypothetical protein